MNINPDVIVDQDPFTFASTFEQAYGESLYEMIDVLEQRALRQQASGCLRGALADATLAEQLGAYISSAQIHSVRATLTGILLDLEAFEPAVHSLVSGLNHLSSEDPEGEEHPELFKRYFDLQQRIENIIESQPGWFAQTKYRIDHTISQLRRKASSQNMAWVTQLLFSAAAGAAAAYGALNLANRRKKQHEPATTLEKVFGPAIRRVRGTA